MDFVLYIGKIGRYLEEKHHEGLEKKTIEL